MKKLLLITMLLGGTFVACKNSPNQIAYKSVVATDTTVITGIKAWNVWVGQGKATLDQERAVKAAFNKWKAAMLLVIDGGKVLAAASTTNSMGVTGLPAAFQQAVAEAAQAQADISNLIHSFGVNF